MDSSNSGVYYPASVIATGLLEIPGADMNGGPFMVNAFRNRQEAFLHSLIADAINMLPDSEAIVEPSFLITQLQVVPLTNRGTTVALSFFVAFEIIRTHGSPEAETPDALDD